MRNLEKEISNLKSKRAIVNMDDIVKNSQEIAGARVIYARIENMDIPTLRATADNIRKKVGASVIVLGSDVKGKVALVCSVSKELVDKGANANDIIKKISQIVGGSGGGRADFAQAGGKDATKLDKALNAVRDVVKGELGK